SLASALGLTPVASGVTPSVTLSNMTPRKYVVKFGDVPDYITPPGKTNVLFLGSSLNFVGNYTFIDVNNNGISDAWEQDYFWSVSPNRTQTTHTDHDGMTDYAEFIAGTDPTDPNSRFRFTSITNQANQLVRMQWTTVSNRLYQVSTSTNLGSWSP